MQITVAEWFCLVDDLSIAEMETLVFFFTSLKTFVLTQSSFIGEIINVQDFSRDDGRWLINVKSNWVGENDWLFVCGFGLAISFFFFISKLFYHTILSYELKEMISINITKAVKKTVRLVWKKWRIVQVKCNVKPNNFWLLSRLITQ